jgi:hypothetical protein
VRCLVGGFAATGLPLVIVPGDKEPLFFERETGDATPDRIHLPDGFFNGVKLLDAYFSPDGTSAILKCQRGPSFTMYKVPMNLSKEEMQKARRVPVPSATPDQKNDAAPENDSSGPTHKV